MKPRLLFYVQHLLGVGHVKRAAAIVRAASAKLEVHVAYGGEPVALADFGAATVHRLPSARSADVSFSALLDADGRPIDRAWQQQRKDLLLALAREIKPRVLLVEHFPFGRGKFAFELLPLFEQLRAQGDCRILSSVRDVLVEKSDAAKSARMVALVRQWFDAVLVHGDPRLVPFSATFPAAAAIADLIEYTGYVTDGPAVTAGAALRDPEAEVVVSIGGGAVGENLLEAAIAAVAAGALASRRWRLLAGHNLAGDVFERLSKLAAVAPGVTLERARPDFRELLARAGLSISQAGYNTVMDLLACRCPALVVPFAAEAESEQLFRARELERRGILSVLEEKDLSPQALAAAADRAIHRPPQASAIDLDGAAGTADALARWAGTA